MGEGVEALITEQGGDKQHHLGHGGNINERVHKRQRLSNLLVGLTGEEGLC